MSWNTVVAYVLISLVSAAITALLMGYALRHRDAPGALAFAWTLGLIAFWSCMAALTALLFFQNRWAFATITENLKYVSLAFIPITWLAMTIDYAALPLRLTRWRIVWLCIFPTLTQILIWTNSLHQLWARSGVQSHSSGLWFWIHTIYSLLLIFIGILILLYRILRGNELVRKQTSIVLVGILIPLGVTLGLTFDMIHYEGMDYTSVAFTVAGLLFAWALFGYRMFDVVPIARDKLIDTLQTGMLVIDQHGRIADINPAALAILGADTPIAVVGRPASEILLPWRELAARFRNEIVTHTEITLQLHDQLREYELDIAPLYDSRRMLVGRLVTLHDITKRKQAERTIRTYTAELEIRNAELDAFAHTVAHDLKTPITGLLGFSALLQRRFDKMDSAKLKENLDLIHATGERLNRIVNELLLLASVRRMDTVQLGPVDLHALVAEVLARMEAQRAEFAGEIITPTAWPVPVGYAPWVEEVLANYVSNALKYGGRPPRVELGADSPQAGFVRIWVRDNGPGLSKEEQQRLFAEFTRLEQSRAQGHGLGLSIVRRIVERLGGQVGVESEPGAGSTFWFTLPAY